MSRKRKLTLLAGALSLALAAGACSSGTSKSSGGSGASSLPAASGSQSLKGVCPDPVVVQTNWLPEAEHGDVYQLLGPGYKIDAANKRISGPLVAGGKSTGVNIEIRAGGPAIGFQPTEAAMYQHPEITLGMAQSDELVQFSKTQPLIAVVAPLDLDPQIIMWDPANHPDWHTIADIGQTNTKVLYFSGTGTYMEYLIGSGILRRKQVDGSYDGSPATFVGSGGKIAVQAYATQEPYQYEHEVKAWDKPVAFQLVTDTGYPNYANTLAVRADKKASLAPCLQRLVPIIQQSEVDFMSNPANAIDIIVKVSEAYKTNVVYSRGNAQFGVEQMRRLGIVGNGKDNTLGNFDIDRIQRLIGIVSPIFAGQKKPIKPNLTPGDIVTNEFVNSSIALKS
jgi:hypothetical protein